MPSLSNINVGSLPIVLNNRVVRLFLDGELVPDFHITFKVVRSTKPDEVNHAIITVWGLSTLSKNDSLENSSDIASKLVENFDGMLVQLSVGWGEGITETPIEFPIFTGICKQIKQGRENESFYFELVCLEGLGIQRLPFRKSWKSGTPISSIINDSLDFAVKSLPSIVSIKNNYKRTNKSLTSIHVAGPFWSWFTSFLAQNLYYPYIDGTRLVVSPINKNDFFDWLDDEFLKSNDPDELFRQLPDYLQEDLNALAIDYGGLRIKNFWQAPINPSNIVSSPTIIQKSVVKKETKKKKKSEQRQEIEVRTLIIPLELNNVYTIQSADFGLDSNGKPQTKKMIVKSMVFDGSNWQPEFYLGLKGLVV